MLVRAQIEGVELDVCSACSKFGKIIANVHRPSPKEQHNKFKMQTNMPQKQKEEQIDLIVENYFELIKSKRESLGMSQKDFAVKINEKESTVHNIETGHFEPPMSLARKLEKALGVKLVEQHEEKHLAVEKIKKGEGFTLGDFISVKK